MESNIIYTDWLPVGGSLEYNGKIYVGTGDLNKIEKELEKKVKEKEPA
jgi:hypothetical protein